MKVATTVTPTSKPTPELICSWLGLPGDVWPPDHYTLLGLSPGDADPLRVEVQVQERLNRVRSYQLSHPAAATEAMNLLAQAFCCLTDQKSRQAYDARLGIRPVAVPVTTYIAALPRASKLTQVPQSSLDTSVNNPVTQVDWSKTAAPVPGPAPSVPEAIPVLEVSAAPAAEAPVLAIPVSPGEPVAGPPAPPPVVEPSPPRPVDPILALACKSQAARRGLGTRRGLYERIQLTRQLLRAWQKLGKYLDKPKCKLKNPAAEAELTRLLVAVFEGLEGFPPILGHPGQPGYRVLAIAEQDTSAGIFKRLDLEQRVALTRDWTDGGNVLQAHLNFLRIEVDKLSRCGLAERLLRTLQWLLQDHSGWVWLGLGVVTAVIVALVVGR